METDYDVVNVCVYHYTNSEEEVREIVNEVYGMDVPEFLENKRIELNFDDITESEIVMSTGDPTSVTDGDWRKNDTLQLEVFSEKDTDYEFAVHTHLVGSSHKTKVWDTYSSILKMMNEKELAVLSGGYVLDSDIDELSISEKSMNGVHENATLENIRFSIDECIISVSEYFGGTYVQAYEDADYEEITRDELLERINSFPDVDIREVVQ